MAPKNTQTTPSSCQNHATARKHPPERSERPERPGRPASFAAVLLAGAAAVLPLAAQAQSTPESSPSMYLQYGAAEHSADSWTVGVTVPWRNWRHSLWGGQLSGYWDVWGARWSAPLEGRDRGTWVIGVNPTVRWRPSNGQSPWFAETGVGLSWALNRRYVTDEKEFPTRYNFATHIGVGYLFGSQGQHELVLRLEHHSNAGIKKPNPGENFLQLRYAHHF